MDFNTTNSFGTRRSYPNLHHISLAPLTPRFPIDDDPEPTDYFSPRDDTTSITPTRTSYLTSVSVPSTPPILSHSRSTSRTRHARSKSSTRAGPLSDTNLQSQNISLPLHHQPQSGHKKRPSASYTRREGPATTDAEWMLRAGIALASSTREEKGQSWLSKRESSTNLVSEVPDSPTHHRHHNRTKSGASTSRKSRSGASTPAAYSRRSSRSRGGSRRGSRAGLTMTTMPPLSTSSAAAAAAAGGKAPSPGTGTNSPEVRGRGALVPDFVDERIRAEMAELQRSRAFSDGDEEEYWDEEANDSEYEYSSDETPDEIDEADLQRLTRERGFGLGSWVDRLVEWTLFGVDELPPAVSSTVASAAATRIGTAPTSTTVTFEEPVYDRAEREREALDTLSLGSDDEVETLSQADGESMAGVEKPGVQGGWEDAGWLFRVMKRALM